jgi:hypothetical protein
MMDWVWIGGLAVVAFLGWRFLDSEPGRNLWASARGTPRPSLLERKRELIVSYIGRVKVDGGRYHVDNLTRDCINEVARRERRPGLSPGTLWLSQWEMRADIPQEWLALKDRIRTALTAKRDALQKKQAEEWEADRQRKRQQLYAARKDLIDKFLEIAERKVSVIDEYGEENWDALPPEIDTCLTKIAKRGGHADKTIKEALKRGLFWSLGDEYQWLRDELDRAFRAYHEAQRGASTGTFTADGLSGIEFETLIGRLLSARGFDVSGTPATGDQGADIIAKKDGKTVIVQAKCYQGAVGNKAVQEVISAVAYYGGDEGWVVTNSSFTPSARALAQKSNVKLIDGYTLKRGAFD